MSRIQLGSFELTDSNKVRLECDIFIPKFSHFPDLLIEFRDELIPSTIKLSKDPTILSGVVQFLKSIGYDGVPPQKLTAEENMLIAEANVEFLSFAEEKGWMDIASNGSAAKRFSLLSLATEEVPLKNISALDEDVLRADGKDYLVLEFDRVSDFVKAGALNNLKEINTGVLAGHSSRKIAESYEERKAVIETKKEELANSEFSEWMREHLNADSAFFVHVAQTLSKEDLYRIALNAQLTGTTENHVIFELQGNR